MLQKKRKELTKFSPNLEKNITEILVTNGRSFEPFVRTFCYKGENVAKSHLGSLVGVFEVGERAEDSAYIVNFLASVAKKEYFAQGKRGPIESFEAALHKINIALAELVKHGNVAWLGKLHGTLGVVEKNNLHFSATGKGKILLLRHGMFTDISIGLASAESALHPMKTFVEVASGHLEAQDKLLFASPEIFRLFSLEELEKNALRLADRFPQFLKTALINELDMAAVVYLSFSEAPRTPAPELTQRTTTENEEDPSVANVFSEQAFLGSSREKPAAAQAPVPEILKSEYIDSKTGHIYVQGETPHERNSHPFWAKIGLELEEWQTRLQNMLGSQRRFFRKARKQSLIAWDRVQETGHVRARALWRGIRRRLLKRKNQPRADALSSVSAPEPRASEPSVLIAESREPLAERPSSEPSGNPSLRSWLLKEKVPALSGYTFRQFLGNARKDTRQALSQISSVMGKSSRWGLFVLRPASRKIGEYYRTLPRRARLMVWGSGLLALVGLFTLSRFFVGSPTVTQNPENMGQSEVAAFAFPPGEKFARLAPDPTLLASRPEAVVTPLFVNTALFLVTENGVAQVEGETFYALPPDSGQVVLATVMEDLQLVFLYTDKKELFSFSPISRAFTTTPLSLPADARVREIGAYLTYLYVLDSTTDQIYRFPRATGGFGAPLSWLKDTVSIEDQARLAVNETIFLSANGATIEGFFRGRKQITLEAPATAPEIRSLFTLPGLTRVYALDAKNKRLIVWNTDGRLEAQYFSEKLGEGKSFSINEKNNEALITTSHELLSLKLESSQ